MASKTIKGLTVEIGGDTTKLGKALQSVEKQSRSLSKELTDINKLLRYDPSNVEALAQKKKILAEQVEACARKLETLRDAQRQVQEQFERGEVTEEQYRALQREIIATENKLDDYKRSLNGVDDALRKLNGEAEETADDVDEMGDEAKEAAKSVDDLGDESKEADNKMSGLGSAAEKAKDGFTTLKGVVANLISEALEELVEVLKEVSKYMVQTGMDFGETMSRVQALSGAEADQMERLTEKAMEMGAKTKFSANESAEAMTYLAQAGWDTEQMLVGINGVMALAATDGIELATAAEITAQAINALGYEASDASKFADILAVTAADTCTSVEDMGYAFQYVGPVAGSLNFSMEDLAVAIGMMADAGINGEKAGTSLRSLFTNMAKPTDAMATAMEKYGISLTDANGNMLPLMDIMVNLRDVFSGLTEAQQTELAATIAGKTGMAGLLSIVNAAPKDFTDMANAVANSTGEAEKMAAVMQDNLAGDVEKLGGAFETLSVQIMQHFDQPLRDATQAITQFLDGEMTMKQLLVELVDVVAQMGQKFMEYLPTLQQIGQDLLVGIINGITVGIPALLNKAVDIVVSLANGIASNMPTIVNVASLLIHDFVQAVFNGIPRLIEAAANIIGSLAQGVTQNAQDFISKGLDLLDGFADKLTSAFPKLVENGMNFILNLVKGVVAAIPEFVQRAPEIISKFANLINDNMPTIFKKGCEIVWELIKGILSLVVELVKNWKSVLNAVVDVWEAFNWLNLGKKCLELMSKGLKAAWGLIKSAATGAKDTLINVLKNLPTTLLNLGKTAITKLGQGIKNCLSSAVSAAKSIITGIIDMYVGYYSRMGEIGINLVKGLWNGISSMASWICEKVMGWGGIVLDAIRAIFQEHSPSRATMVSGKNLVLGLAEGIDDTADEAIHAAENLAAGVLDGASMDGLALERDLQNRTVKRALSVTTAADSSMLGKLDKILTAIERGQIITLDGKALVGGTANMYDSALGQRRMLAARGAV